MPSKVSNLYSKDDPTMIVYPNVQAANIPSNAITTDKVADGAITTAKVNDGAITNAKIASLAITSGKLANSAVTTGKIDTAAVTESKIVDNSIGTSKIKDNAVTAIKLSVSTTAFSGLGLAGATNAAVYSFFTGLLRGGKTRFLFDDGEIVTPLFVYCDAAESPNWVKAFRYDDDGTIITYTLCDNNSDIDTFLASANAGYCKIIG